MALNDPITFKSFKWQNSQNSTEGEIKILMDKPSYTNSKGIGSDLCRVYISKIKIKKKKKTKNLELATTNILGAHTIDMVILFSHI